MLLHAAFGGMATGCCAGGGVVPEPPSEQDIFTKLSSAEDKIWRIAFARIDDESKGKVPVSHALLQEYMLRATSLSSEDEVQATLISASDGESVTLEQFQEVMRSNAFDDGMAITYFSQVAGEGGLESPEARTLFRQIGERHVNTSQWDEATWDRVLNEVMKDADFMVDMEWWIGGCKLFARYARCLEQQRASVL